VSSRQLDFRKGEAMAFCICYMSDALTVRAAQALFRSFYGVWQELLA
jgi:hypothetical protein